MKYFPKSVENDYFCIVIDYICRPVNTEDQICKFHPNHWMVRFKKHSSRSNLAHNIHSTLMCLIQKYNLPLNLFGINSDSLNHILLIDRKIWYKIICISFENLCKCIAQHTCIQWRAVERKISFWRKCFQSLSATFALTHLDTFSIYQDKLGGDLNTQIYNLHGTILKTAAVAVI